MQNVSTNPFIKAQLERLTRKVAAQFLGFSEKSLSVFACTHRHSIPYYKIGRKVFYNLSDLQKWVDSRRITGGGDL